MVKKYKIFVFFLKPDFFTIANATKSRHANIPCRFSTSHTVS